MDAETDDVPAVEPVAAASIAVWIDSLLGRRERSVGSRRSDGPGLQPRVFAPAAWIDQRSISLPHVSGTVELTD